MTHCSRGLYGMSIGLTMDLRWVVFGVYMVATLNARSALHCNCNFPCAMRVHAAAC